MEMYEPASKKDLIFIGIIVFLIFLLTLISGFFIYEIGLRYIMWFISFANFFLLIILFIDYLHAKRE